MTTTVSVVLHNLEDAHALNLEVSEILRLLERPLPTERLNEARLLPILPPDFQCVKSLPVIPKDDGGPARQPGMKLVTEILDIVLMSVVYLRSSRQCSHGFRERQSYWVSMLAACGMAMDDKVIVSDDMPIARARTSSRKDVPLDLEELNTEAKMTLSALIPPTPRHHSRGNARASEEAQDSSSTSDASYDSYVTVDLPFDAHVTPGRGKRVHCLLPIVYAARQEDMQALMTSFVCQRRFLNITTPVVGLVLPEEGTLASLSLGWADLSSSQPTVHLAHTRPDSGNNVGLFDGSNPISALRLAQFILDLEPYFASIKQHAVQPQVQDFCWRLDHAYLDYSNISRSGSDNATCSNDGQSRVNEWLATLHLADTPEPIPPLSWEFFGLAEGLLVAEDLAANPATTSPSSDDSSIMSDSRSRPSRHNTSKSPSSTPTSPPESSKSAKHLSPDSARQNSASGKDGSQQSNAGGTPSAASASNYAKPTPDDLRGLVWYGRHRDCIPLAVLAVKPENTTNTIDRKIGKMGTLYDTKTQPGWPEGWKRLRDLPACDDSLDGIRTALFEGYGELVTSNVKLTKLTKDSPVVSSLENRFSAILYSVAIAVAAMGNSQDGAHVEAATREAWDFILRSICSPPGQATSSTFFVEQTIQLPANKASRFGKDFDAKRSATLELHLATVQMLKFEKLSSDSNPDEADRLDAIAQQARHARAQAVEYSDLVKHSSTAFLQRAASSTDPRTARVDGMHCLRFDPGQSRPDLVKKIKGWTSAFRGYLHLHPKSPSAVCKAEPVDKQSGKEPATQSTANVELPHAQCFACPSISRSLRKDRPFTQASSVRSKGDIFIPVLLAEYKKDSYQIQQAYNQMKFYVISAVEFLASIGVQDFPVWGLVCSGSEGVIAMAWKSTLSHDPEDEKLTSRDYNFIFDRNLRRFNLCDPIQAFQFFVVMYGLYETQTELRKRLIKSDVQGKLMSDKFNEWMMPKREPTPAAQPTVQSKAT